jgi:hypothetical protein
MRAKLPVSVIRPLEIDTDRCSQVREGDSQLSTRSRDLVRAYFVVVTGTQGLTLTLRTPVLQK